MSVRWQEGREQGILDTADAAVLESPARLQGFLDGIPGLYGLAGGAVLGAAAYFSMPGPLWIWAGPALVLCLLSFWRGWPLPAWALAGALLIGSVAYMQAHFRDMGGIPARGDYAGIGQVISQEPRGDGLASIIQVDLPDEGWAALRLRHDDPLQTGAWYQLVLGGRATRYHIALAVEYLHCFFCFRQVVAHKPVCFEFS